MAHVASHLQPSWLLDARRQALVCPLIPLVQVSRTTQAMKTTYMVQAPGHWKPAIADLSLQPDGAWYINRINVPEEFRGKGYGTRLLKQVLQDADAEGAILLLDPVPSGGLSRRELTDWYLRYGFEIRPRPGDGLGLLERVPKGD